jgi:diguanylate cyclase (GGDEF)-like protein
VLFIDVDRFKVVNDSLGHRAGDQLLVAVAERIRSVLRPGDTVARFGGDEFVVLLDVLGTEGEAVHVAERILAAVAQPVELAGSRWETGLSVGIAFSRPERRPEDLIRDADTAMYQAKARGRGRYEVFDEELRAALVQRRETEQALRRALARDELRVVYQPTIDLRTGSVVGVEALLRWAHPTRGLLEPDQFLQVAADTGLIVPIGAWVVEQACLQAARWHRRLAARHPLEISINLASGQLDSPGLLDTVARAIRRAQVDPGQVCLEITESVVMRNPAATGLTLRGLKNLGVDLAVDDFGTGYSSLAHLRRFPLDILKIDGAFVDRLGQGPEDDALVAAVINLAATLGLTAVAEGVETAAQLDLLAALGCHLAQGFLLSRPLPAEGIDALLDATG